MGFAVAPLVSLAISVGSQLLLGLFKKSPKQEDPLLQMPKSDYGVGIPKIYGRVRLEGNKFFPQTTDLMYDVINEGGGGKGGGRSSGQRQKKIFGTVALLYCEGKARVEKIIIQGEHIEVTHPFFQQYCTWFDGTQNDVWSVVSQDEPPYNLIKYKGVAFLGIEKMPLDRYGNQIPSQISAVIVDDEFGVQPTLSQVVGSILTKAGIDSNLWDVSDLGGIRLRDGIAVKQSGESYQETIESLMELYLFAPYQDTDGKLIFKRIRRGDTSVLTVDNRVLIGDDDRSYLTEIKSDFELPTKLSIKFYNNSRVFESDEVNVFLGNKAEKDNNVKTLPEILFTYSYEAEERSREILSYLYSIEKNSYSFKLPIWYYSQFNCLDVLTLPNGQTVQITKINVGADYTVEITTNFYDSVQSSYISTPDPPIIPPALPDPAIPDIFIIDAPVIDNDIPGSLYCFATDGLATIEFSDNQGDSWQIATTHLRASTIGNCLTILGDEVEVEIISGSDLESITDNEYNIDLGQNLCFIGKETAQGCYEGEFLQYRDATVTGVRRFVLTTLKKGLNNTGGYVHTSGEKFFLFKGVGSYYSVISGRASLIDQVIYFRPIISEWQDLATTPVVILTPIGNSFKPVAPTDVTGIYDTEGNIRLFWEYEPPYNPYNNSTEIITFETEIIKPDLSVRILPSDVTQVDYLVADRTLDDVALTLDVKIFGISSVVGRGYPFEGQVTPVLVDDTIFNTGDGIRGIKFIYEDYTILEEDLSYLIIVVNPDATTIILTFPSTLSNGFLCYVINQSSNNNLAKVELLVGFSYTKASDNFISTGKSVQVFHISLGKYFVFGNSSNLMGYENIVGGVTGNFTLMSNTLYEVTAPANLTFPSNPVRGDLIHIVDSPGTFSETNFVTLIGNGNNIEGATTFRLDKKEENIEFYFNGFQWVYKARFFFIDYRDIQPHLVDQNGNLFSVNNGKIVINSGGGTGTGLTFYFYNADFTAELNSLNAVNTANSAVTATLPTNPPNGTQVGFYDFGVRFATNNLIIVAGSGNNILDEPDLRLTTDNSTVQLVFCNNKWSVFGTEIFVDRIAEGSGGGTPTPVFSATTTIEGIARLATIADFTPPVNNTKIVTPSLLEEWSQDFEVPLATETVAGIAMLATSADFGLLPATDKIVTPAVLPIADTEKKGIAERATNEEAIAGVSQDTFITPANLEFWRIENGIVKNATTGFDLYVSQDNFHSLSGVLRNTDPNHGDSVTYTQYLANINNPLNEGSFWQLFDPNVANFRCLKTLRDVSRYGNNNLTTSDTLTLFLDAGKYECNYTFNFGIVVNGVNNLGADGWGDPSGTNNDTLIFYTTTTYSLAISVRSLSYRSRSMIINSEVSSRINFVHFWSWVTAVKDSTLTWNLKSLGENTIEQHWQNIDAEVYSNNSNLYRVKYITSFRGLGFYSPLLILQNNGDKNLNYCTFTGIGTSIFKINGDNFQGGYIFVENSCNLSFVGIVFRGNEEIRVSDKRGRKVTTPSSSTPVYIPINSIERGDDSTWTYVDLYDSNGEFIQANVQNFNFGGVFHDPYTEEFVSIGFCDIFLGVGKEAVINITFSNGFNDNKNYFGRLNIANFSSALPDGSFTLNNDLNCIRIEQNQGQLFGTEDDRIITSQLSTGFTGVDKFRFRGTDILGDKISDLYPPVLTYINGDVANKNATNNNERDAFNNWVNNFKNQGSTVNNFINSQFNFVITCNDFSLWSDRDSRGYITGSGFIGKFGYLLRTNNLKLQPILSYDFFSINSPYGQGLVWNKSGVASQLTIGNQYQYNFLKSIWTGFDKGRYIYPVIVDVGANYNNYLTEINASPPSYSNVVTKLLADGHSLNGSTVGARFLFVGSNNNEEFSLMFLGYSDTNPIDYYFVQLGANTGIDLYRNATIINSINQLNTLSGNIDNLYIKNSNLLLTNQNYDNDVTDINNWQPINLELEELPLFNATNLGLFSNNYVLGLQTDKYGININSQDNSLITETSIKKTVTAIYNGAGFPNNLNLNSNDYQTLLAMLKSGFYGKELLKGLFIILLDSDVEVTA